MTLEAKDPVSLKSSKTKSLRLNRKFGDGFMLHLDEKLDRSCPVGDLLCEGIEVTVLQAYRDESDDVRVEIEVRARPEISISRTEEFQRPLMNSISGELRAIEYELNGFHQHYEYLDEYLDAIGALQIKAATLKGLEQSLWVDIRRAYDNGYGHTNHPEHRLHCFREMEHGVLKKQIATLNGMIRKLEADIRISFEKYRGQQQDAFAKEFYALAKEQLGADVFKRLASQAKDNVAQRCAELPKNLNVAKINEKESFAIHG